MLHLLLKQTSTKKKIKGGKNIINHSKSCYHYFEGNQYLCKYQYKHEIKK